MLKKTAAIVFAVLLCPNFLLAEEGMWLPMLLGTEKIEAMREKGMLLSAEDIYAINQPSLKDAIVKFGNGCTGEVISDRGLVLTNHHCGYGSIQKHSSLENNLLQDGFWAKTKSEELPNKGLTVTFVQRIEDVTEKMKAGIKLGMPAEECESLKQTNRDAIVAAALEEEGVGAFVESFYHDNQFFLFVTKTYRDIRLVGAPPSGIGKFGRDTDNWVWPRHTGDFSLFRIYANSENEPADYATENQPYQPVHHLPIALGGVEEGDFTMVYGFPGRTMRFATSYEVDWLQNHGYPARIKMRAASLDVLGQAMLKDPLVHIQYAAKQSGISNAYKKWKGEVKGLKALNVLDQKQAFEQKLTGLIQKNEAHKEKYGQILEDLKQTFEKRFQVALARAYYRELMYYSGPEILDFAQRFVKLAEGHTQMDMQQRKEEIERLERSVKGHFKNYDVATDRLLFVASMGIFTTDVSMEMQPVELKNMLSKNKGNVKLLAARIYEQSVFGNEAAMGSLLKDFGASAAKKIKKDPAYQLMLALSRSYFNDIRPAYDAHQGKIDELMKMHVASILELLPDEALWPDANGTLRVSYGNVKSTSPRDAVHFDYFTTHEGVLEKINTAHPDFETPDRLIELFEQKDFGRYGQEGELRLCFIASNHTTGGNSGSPVINAKGELIGLNFDRSWESTMSDIQFDENRCRNIAVDIRYVLFVIDKFAGASHLIDEMTLIDQTFEKAQKPQAIDSAKEM